MNRKTIPFFVSTLVAAVEWLLFELIRAPYRPPVDMTTLLGTEKYTVATLMAAIFIVGLLAIVFAIGLSGLTRRGYSVFAIWLICLAFGIGIVIFYPPWPVTPADLIWK